MNIFLSFLIPSVFQGIWTVKQYPTVKLDIQSNKLEAFSNREGCIKILIKDVSLKKEDQIQFKIDKVMYYKNETYKDYLNLLKINQYINWVNKNSLDVEIILNHENKTILNYNYLSYYYGKIDLNKDII